MSSAAFGYYEANGLLLGVTPPEILQGQPVDLLKPLDPRTIAVHSLKSPVATGVAEQYRVILDEVAGFVLAVEADGNGQVVPTTLRKDTYAAAVTSHLKPRDLKTGRFESVTVEAITPAEVPETAIKGFTPSIGKRVSAALGDAASNAVCLVTSAEVSAGRQRGQTRCLTVVAAEVVQGGLRRIAYFSSGFNDNNNFGRAVVEDSGRTAHIVTASQMAIPVQQRRVSRPESIPTTIEKHGL